MSDDINKITTPGDEQTEDNITFHTGFKKEEAPQRNIKAAPVVHTSGNQDFRVPESAQPEELPQDKVVSRFIKTNNTPFVSVSSKEPETDGADIDRYSDRITVKAPEKKIFAGFTAKLNVYSETHSADAENGRMIQTAQEPAAAEVSAPENAPAPTVSDEPEVQTKEVSFDRNGKAELDDVLDSAPTKPMKDPKGSLLREIAGTADDGVRRNPDQLMMEGFDSVGKTDEAEKAREEAELADKLIKTRQERISSFKFWDKKKNDASRGTPDEKFSGEPEKTALPSFLAGIAAKFEHLDTDFNPVKGEEYTDFNNRKEVFSELIEARKSVLYRLFAIGLAGIILLIINIAASASASADADGFFSLFGGSYPVFAAVNLAVLLAAAVLMFRELKTGLFSLLKMHPKADTSLLLLMVSAIVQNICAFFTQLKLEENFHLMAPAAVLLCVPYLLSKLFYYDNARQCFKAVAVKSEKSYLRRISDEQLVAELLRDRESGTQNVVYSGKTRFVSGFLSRSANSAYAGMPSSRSVLIAAAASVLIGIIAAIVKQDAVYGITALTASLAFSFPVSCLTATGYKISSENKKLSVKSSFVQSHNDARDFAAIDNIILDAADIFTAQITNCLTAKGVSDKQAKFCAAVLTSKFGGPLNSALMESVGSLEDKFPAAENPVYEEKLGLSAWVSNCKVLLGTHTLLVNHNVQVPDEKAVSAFLAEDEIPVYLAIEGRFAAVLGVKYVCKGDSADNLRELVKSGANILLLSHDASLTENYAEELLGMPECSVRTVSAGAAEKLGASMQAITDCEDAGIVFADSCESLCRCACAAMRLDRSKKTSKLVCEAGAYVGLALAAVLSFAGVFASLSSVLPVLVQALWLVLCFAAPLMFSSPVTDVKKSMPKINIELPSVKAGRKKNAAAEENTDGAYAEEEPAESENVPEDAEQLTMQEAADTAEQENASAEKAAAAEPENADVPENDEEEDIPGVITQRTYDALDALAGDVRVEKKTAAEDNGVSDGKSEEELPDEYEPDEDDDETANSVISETVDKAKRFFGGIVSRFTVAKEPDDDDFEEYGNENDAENENEAPKNRPFTASLPVRKHRPADIETEDDVLLRAREEARMRASFTPPEMPAAPHYELGKKEVKEEKNPLDERFVPPEPSHSSFYSDSQFSRFEDDNIFAALHEEDNGKKYDI